MTHIVKRGTARRLGLRLPYWYPCRERCAHCAGREEMGVMQPDGSNHRLVCGGSRARIFFVDELGRAVHDVPVALNVGPGSLRWEPGVWSKSGMVVHIGETRLA